MVLKNKKTVLEIGMFIGFWLLFTMIHAALKSYSATQEYSGLFSAIFALIFEFVVIYYTIRIWWVADNVAAKRVFGWFLLSFVFILIMNFSYQILFNILHISHNYLSGFLLTFNNIPYMGFLLCQLIGWSLVLPRIDSQKKRVLVYLPGILIVFAVLLMLFLVLNTQSWHSFKLERSYNILEAILQISSFVVALLCLVTAKHKSIAYLALGYLIIVGADLTMNFDIFAQHFGAGSFAETFWILGALFRVYGVIKVKNTKLYNITPKDWTSALNSNRTQVLYWVFAVILLIFVTIYYF